MLVARADPVEAQEAPAADLAEEAMPEPFHSDEGAPDEL
jgi:hypothetical protein